MRDRLTELLPLLLVGVVLVVFQFTRTGELTTPFLPLVEPSPTPPRVAATAPAPPRGTPTARAAPLQTDPACSPRQPTFARSIASLKSVLGSSMGDPLECESAVDTDGDTQQLTTTGLAYYRKLRNIACFTTGWDHWALASDGRLIHWASEAVDPPADAMPVSR